MEQIDNSEERDQLNMSENPSQYGGRPSDIGTGAKKQQPVEPKRNNIPGIDAPHELNMDDVRITSKFSLGNRIKKGLSKVTACCKTPYKTAAEIRDTAPMFTFEDMFPGHKNKKLALKLDIHGTGILEMDQHVLHPFVRVHIVDLRTNKYLAKVAKDQPGVANRESCSFFRIDPNEDNKDHKVPEYTDANFFLPFSTRMFDLRIKGNNFCEWNEDFVINENVANIFQRDVLIMFEILDFVPLLVVDQSSLLRPDKLYPVAWAYLRPLGSAQIHCDKVKLQLFKYKYRTDASSRFNNPLDPRTPDVLVELHWPDRELFNSFLEVELSFVNKSEEIVQRKHISRAPWEEEVGLYKYSAKHKAAKGSAYVIEEEDDMNVVKRLRKWDKFAELDSELPDRLVWKFESEAQGCFRLKFCHTGKYLAAACTLSNNKTVIKIFDVEDGNLQIILKGHNDLIHDLDWSWDDRYLVSASADGTVRIWNLTEKEIEHSDKLNYQDNDRLFFLGECFHPSYVYGAKIHPTRDEPYKLYVASICFDSKVRVWKVDVGADPEDDPAEPEEMYVKSITDAAQFTVGAKRSQYDQDDNLEDQALRLLLNPQDIENASMSFASEPASARPSSGVGDKKEASGKDGAFLTPRAHQKLAKDYKHLLEQRHPNTLTFDRRDRLFVGDSKGHITVFRITVDHE